MTDAMNKVIYASMHISQILFGIGPGVDNILQALTVSNWPTQPTTSALGRPPFVSICANSLTFLRHAVKRPFNSMGS